MNESGRDVNDGDTPTTIGGEASKSQLQINANGATIFDSFPELKSRIGLQIVSADASMQLFFSKPGQSSSATLCTDECVESHVL